MKIKCKCGRELEIEWVEQSKQEKDCCDMDVKRGNSVQEDKL